MKELFIKCPSCGVILGVKNSKNEAVKKIVCPQCKKQLAVSFEEEKQQSAADLKPLGTLYYGEMPIALQEGVNNTQFPGSDKVSLKVVRLADGGSKCIVQPLAFDGSVKINGEVLQKGDEVVLAKGDRLEIAHVVLYYDKPYSLPVNESKPETKAPQKPNVALESLKSPKSPKGNHTWLYAVVGLMAFAIVAFLLWPKQGEKSQPKSKAADTVTVANPKKKTDSKEIKGEVREQEKREKETSDKPVEASKKARTKYDLEQAALHGDPDAQLELGRELVKCRESHQVILGLNYLRQAQGRGSSEAGRIWHQTVRELQRKATTDSAAYYILMTIDH